MKITPMAAPAQSVTQSAPGSQVGQDARSRAISALMGDQGGATQGNLQTEAVADPNRISAEERSAVVAPTQTTEIVDKNTVTEVTTEAKDPAVEKQFQEIARQERILRAKAQKQAQELKSAQEALAAKEAALAEREKQLDPTRYISRDRIKTDTLSALAELDVDYNTLTEQMLSQTPKDPRVEAQFKSLEQTIKSLEAKLAANEQSAKQSQSESYQQALKQIERDATKLVTTDTETYEAIHKTKSIRDVVDLIEETYKAEGYLMTVEEAAQEVENYLVEESFNTVSRIEKIKKRLSQASASTTPAKEEVKQLPAKTEETTAQMKTLTNASASTRKLSARERALLAFKGEKF